MNLMDNKNTIVFATSNNNKIFEINKLLPKDLNIIIKSKDIVGINEEIPETGKTIEENAIQKAKYVYDNYGYNCFGEDTGLFVESLNGEPGIYSARYAGEDRNDFKNIQKILDKLKKHKNRKAYFKTVIALIINGDLFTFEGKIKGDIVKSPKGEKGFGYDPIFQPVGFNKTFAELGIDIKNNISHRALALNKFLKHLNT